MKTVIIAGGEGTRLRPYTTILPKPLMPIGNQPILEIIIKQLESQGLKDITISTGRLSELIMSFFGDGKKLGVNIKYSKEDQPLGTVGGLGLIKDELKDTFLIINGDTLTTLAFSDLINYHKKNRGTATIALNKRSTYIDYGVVELDSNSNIQGYIEKPTIDHLVSMGVNVLEPKILEYIKPRQKTDFPDLILQLISNGEPVKGFVFEGRWLDMGRIDDYNKINTELDTIKKEFKISIT
ncbi:NDP-sugar synthase [Chloroflexota bacterium]